MIRRRLYNPAQLTSEELKASFVAREETLAEMLRVIGGQMPGRPCQHMMLIGPRGMGKTTLGLRFLYAVEDDPNLAAQWQPVAFHEESYGIGNLAEFWLAALQHLTRATGDPRWADRADSLAENEGDTQRLTAYALAALLDFSEASGKRLILFVENLDAILGQLRNEREIHALRASLIERREILLLGSANAVFEAIRGYGQPFYEFFRLFTLEGLGQADARRMLEAFAHCEGKPEIPETLYREHGRLETIRRLTGGNPRLLVLSCRMLIESPLGPAIEDLEQLIDEQTPYFKARIEDLPVQARKVFHGLSEGWKPMLAKEVAGAAKLSSSHASAQLKQLLEKGYVREVRLPGAKRARYEVSDRFYNIYYLLRFSHTGRDRLERLVAFLHDLFSPAGMRTMYPAALAALRADGVGTTALSEWLGVLAPHVAGDPHYEGREDWQREALAIVADRVGPNAPIIQIIREEFADNNSNDSVELRKAAAMTSGLSGHFLAELGRDEEALAAWERASEHIRTDDPAELRRMTAKMLALVAADLSLQERYNEAESVCRMATDIDPDCDKPWIVWAQAILNQNDTDRLPEAQKHARRVVELAPENPEALRTLSNILACQGKWTEALDQLENALRMARSESQDQEVTSLTESLIRAVAAGNGPRVMDMMEAAGLAESMEPLWHAIRAELGEELEPLPTEIMIAVTEIRQRFSAANSKSQP